MILLDSIKVKILKYYKISCIKLKFKNNKIKTTNIQIIKNCKAMGLFGDKTMNHILIINPNIKIINRITEKQI